MRARIAIAILLVCAIGAAASADLRKTAIGFDHNLHDRHVVVGGGDSIACTRCHSLRSGLLAGRPGHGACFGTCHGAPPTAKPETDPDRIRLCTSCHAEAALAAKRPGVAFPPYAIDPDFALTIGHKQHAPVACTTCHVMATPHAAAVPHRRCASCHDGAAGHGPPMTACAGCHVKASGKPQPPAFVAAPITVASTFSHARHAGRGTAGKQCATCHAAVRETNENDLPRPTARSCATAGCHDGTAFPISRACTRCHRDVPDRTFHIPRPETRFTHATHDRAMLPCATCHPVSPSGEVLVSGHAPCVGCHPEDFDNTKPVTICGACHNTTEPWRPLVPDRLPSEHTEFGATLDHRKHPGACTSCHSLTTATSQLRPPRGHRACTGCHAAPAGPAPAMTDCRTCHRRELANERVATRLAQPWSARAQFDHAAHVHTADGGALACTACHSDLTAPGLLSLATPAKAACAPCHDGATAFKLTGTTCTRCHPGPKR